jgi:hypothetical protein
MLRRLIPHVAPAVDWWVPTLPGWLGIAFTYQGLKALGVPQASLDTFPQEFREGMAARAFVLNDVGDSAPSNWELEFSYSLFASWPRIRKGTSRRIEFTQDFRVSLVDVRDSVSIQFFAHKIRKCFAICQFVVGNFTYCLGDATAGQQRLNFPFLDDSVEKQRRLNATQLDGECSEH